MKVSNMRHHHLESKMSRRGESMMGNAGTATIPYHHIVTGAAAETCGHGCNCVAAEISWYDMMPMRILLLAIFSGRQRNRRHLQMCRQSR